MRRTAERGQVLFHGPYWFLRQGVWRCRFHGEVRGALLIAILERFGHRVLEFPIDERKTEHVLVVPRDVVYFECAAYATSPQAEVTLDCVEFVREG